MNDKTIEQIRNQIQQAYSNCPFGYKGGFDEILCFELHSQPVNPRMGTETGNNGFETGLTFKELAAKWGVTLSVLGELIADHCRKLESLSVTKQDNEMKHEELQVIYQNNVPYGIRDKTGFLFFFRTISAYDGQDERYRKEIEELVQLAEDLLAKLKLRK